MPAAVPSGRLLFGRSFDHDSLTIFAAFTTPPTFQRKVLIDQWVKALKVAGVWPLLDVYYLFDTATQQQALLNWKNPGTFTASLTNAPTFAADRGFTGNGTSSFVSTYNPSTAGGNYSTAGATVFGRIQTASGTNHCVMGASVSNPALTSGASGNGASLVTTGFYGGAGLPSAAGFYSYSEQAGVGSMYNNGSLSGSASVVGGTPTVPNTALLTLSRTSDFSTDTMASFGAGGFLTAAQHAALAAADLAYAKGVGAA